MAQRQESVQTGVRSTRGWHGIFVVLSLLLLIIPGLPASLSIAGGVALIVLLCCILHEDGQRRLGSGGE